MAPRLVILTGVFRGISQNLQAYNIYYFCSVANVFSHILLISMCNSQSLALYSQYIIFVISATYYGLTNHHLALIYKNFKNK